MPTKHHRRAAPCTRCGDVVLIAETTARAMFGSRAGKAPKIGLEHADPGPNGEVFDAVDDGCLRPAVR